MQYQTYLVSVGQFWGSVAASILASWIVGYFIGKKRARSSYYPKRIKRGTRKNTVLVVGLGRSGKSCLIETLTRTLAPKSPELTNNFSIKSCKKEEKGQQPVYFHFTDYRGQNFSQLVSSFIKEQFVPNSLLRYGDINSLILVVDLFGADDDEEGLDEKFEEIDADRVNYHTREWNTTALDAVFGLLTQEQLKYVCLFVNKADKWANGGKAEAEKKIRQLFVSLVNDLRDRARGTARFDIIIGSALLGTGVSGLNRTLMQRLFRYSVPLLKEDEKDEG